MLPNARLEGLGVSVPGETRSPERLSTIFLVTWSAATVSNETLPLKFPPPVGANVIVAEADVPAISVSGRARLLMENPAPLIAARVMVRSVPPLFARVTVLVWWLPTVVFPKATGEGLGESFPRVTALPEADSET